MIQSFRRFFSSKIGIVVTLAFLALIALAFASMDISSTGTFGGVAGGDRVAVVGDERIDAAELQTAAASAVDRQRQNDPTISMEAFLEAGGLEQVLDQLLQRTALAAFAREHGMRAGARLVDGEIVKIPAFRGATGEFDANAFRAALAQQGLTEAAVRQDLETGLLARQVLTPITFSPVVPNTMVRRYAALLRERRQGAVAVIPSEAYAPQAGPSQAQLQAFYQEARGNFIRPERRVIRYAVFGDEALGELSAPTEAQIAERYQRDRAQYAASERRRFTQLVAPTQAAAQAIVAEVRGGKPLDAAAREKGLATTAVGPATRAEFAAASSAAVAQAAFTAERGAIAAPTRGALGWYVLRVDEVERQPARPLAQVRGEIAAALAAEQRREALDDLTARIDDDFGKGRSLSEVAEELGVTINRTAPATADGRVYGRGDETVPAVLAPVLPVAFEMEEENPQLAVAAAGQSFIMFDVSDVTPSSAAPLAEVRDDVIRLWRRDQGAKAARAAAERIIQRVSRGTELSAAVAAERKAIPPVEQLDLGREELARSGRIPPSMALFFSMAEGTVKKLEGPADAGWYVVKLDNVEAGQVAPNDPVLAATLRQLGQAAAEEYITQFVRAAQEEVGVERNEAAIKAVATALGGGRAN